LNGAAPHILLVNPWIHDFAAYDFWSKPLGLLTLAGILRGHGLPLSYIDCLDRHHPRASAAEGRDRCGRGPYHKIPIRKPACLADVPRTFSRYGIEPGWLREDLRRIPRPDLILVTSMMTYWYTGVQETIAELRRRWCDVPIHLGGVYATLCPEHARNHAGADRVVAGAGEPALLERLELETGFRTPARFDPDDLDSYPYPAFDLQHRIDYVPLTTSRGCPFACPYCASGLLQPEYRRRSPQRVFEEIRYWNENFGVRDFVFYDDALLYDAANHFLPLVEKVIGLQKGLRFHTPNALHIRWITPAVARAMRGAGFETIRLGLETADRGDRPGFDRKVTSAEFHQAVANLGRAGFAADRIGVYLLVGLPGQSPAAVAESIHRVRKSGATPVPAYYSPIPNTAMWPQAAAASRYELDADPLYGNNAVMPCQRQPFSWKQVSRIKAMAAGKA